MPIKNETGTVVFFLISVKDISKSNVKMSFAREREGVCFKIFEINNINPRGENNQLIVLLDFAENG